MENSLQAGLNFLAVWLLVLVCPRLVLKVPSLRQVKHANSAQKDPSCPWNQTWDLPVVRRECLLRIESGFSSFGLPHGAACVCYCGSGHSLSWSIHLLGLWLRPAVFEMADRSHWSAGSFTDAMSSTVTLARVVLYQNYAALVVLSKRVSSAISNTDHDPLKVASDRCLPLLPEPVCS